MSELEEALAQLRQGSSKARLRAARRVGAIGDTSIIPELRLLRAREGDSWVRSALDGAIRRLGEDSATRELGQGWISTPADRATEDIQAAALQNTAKTIIHEIRPLIRSLTLVAQGEIADFDDSQTAAAIQRLRDFLETLERLQSAANSPVETEFDLRDMTLRIIRDLGHSHEHVALFRDEPTIVRGDPELLTLALRNLICNAVEASIATKKRVTVNYATTEASTWIVVLDEGTGLPDNFDKVWEPGKTLKSKKDHFGWGLSIAQRAVHSFGGSITLTPRETGGTAGEIRWSASTTTEDDK